MISEILHSNTLIIDYLRRLAADVPEDWMTRQFTGIQNHPAWIIGHLVYSYQSIGGEIGVPAWLPDGWESQFGTGSAPVETRTAYADKASLLHALDVAHRKILTALAAMEESDMQKPLPDLRFREIFPTVGHAVLHVLTAHAAVHLGQAIVWRRASGLKPLTEPFI